MPRLSRRPTIHQVSSVDLSEQSVDIQVCNLTNDSIYLLNLFSYRFLRVLRLENPPRPLDALANSFKNQS